MPIYEYTCAKCGELFEALIRKDSDVPVKCRKCGSVKITKNFSSFAVASATSSSCLPCSDCSSLQGGSTSCGGASSCPYS